MVNNSGFDMVNHSWFDPFAQLTCVATISHHLHYSRGGFINRTSSASIKISSVTKNQQRHKGVRCARAKSFNASGAYRLITKEKKDK
jgi:hypothetical protein